MIAAGVDLWALLGTRAANNTSEAWPLGYFLVIILGSGTGGYAYAYYIETRSAARVLRRNAVIVWVASAPEVILLIPLIASMPGKPVAGAGTLLGEPLGYSNLYRTHFLSGRHSRDSRDILGASPSACEFACHVTWPQTLAIR